VLADRARGGPEPRVREIGRAGPLPAIAEQRGSYSRLDRAGVVELDARRRVMASGDRFPLELGRQPRPGPLREGVGLVVGYVGDWRAPVALAPAGQRELPIIAPVERGLDPLGDDPG